MGIGTGGAALIGGLGAAGSVGGALIGANSANKAANAQASADEYSANLDAQLAQENLGFQEDVFQQEEQNQLPFLQGGAGAEVNLLNLMGINPSTFATTPVPGSTPTNFPQFQINPNGPNPIVTSPGSGNGGSPAWMTPGAQRTVPLPAGGDGASATPFPQGVSLSSMLDPSLFNGVLPGSQLPPLSSNANNAVSSNNNAVLSNSSNSLTNFGSLPTGDVGSNGARGNILQNGTGTSATNGVPLSTMLTPAQSLQNMTGNPDIGQILGPGGSPDLGQPAAGQPGAGGGTVAMGSGSTTPSGGVPLSSLLNPSLGATGSLMQQWPFEFAAPTNVTEQNDPGYQFRQQQGQQALENQEAATGSLLSGGSAKALDQYNQNYASNEYGNVYNRALTNYQQAYNQFQQSQTNQFNRLADIAGLGQLSAGQLNSSAANTGSNVNNLLLGAGNQIGSALQNAGTARASGYVGAGNAYSGGLQGLTGIASLLAMMQQQANA